MVRQKISEMPGKLDHATVVAYQVGYWSRPDVPLESVELYPELSRTPVDLEPEPGTPVDPEPGTPVSELLPRHDLLPEDDRAPPLVNGDTVEGDTVEFHSVEVDASPETCRRVDLTLPDTSEETEKEETHLDTNGNPDEINDLTATLKLEENCLSTSVVWIAEPEKDTRLRSPPPPPLDIGPPPDETPSADLKPPLSPPQLIDASMIASSIDTTTVTTTEGFSDATDTTKAMMESSIIDLGVKMIDESSSSSVSSGLHDNVLTASCFEEDEVSSASEISSECLQLERAASLDRDDSGEGGDSLTQSAHTSSTTQFPNAPHTERDHHEFTVSVTSTTSEHLNARELVDSENTVDNRLTTIAEVTSVVDTTSASFVQRTDDNVPTSELVDSANMKMSEEDLKLSSEEDLSPSCQDILSDDELQPSPDPNWDALSAGKEVTDDRYEAEIQEIDLEFSLMRETDAAAADDFEMPQPMIENTVESIKAAEAVIANVGFYRQTSASGVSRGFAKAGQQAAKMTTKKPPQPERPRSPRGISKTLERLESTLKRKKKHKRGSPTRHTVAVDAGWFRKFRGTSAPAGSRVATTSKKSVGSNSSEETKEHAAHCKKAGSSRRSLVNLPLMSGRALKDRILGSLGASSSSPMRAASEPKSPNAVVDLPTGSKSLATVLEKEGSGIQTLPRTNKSKKVVPRPSNLKENSLTHSASDSNIIENTEAYGPKSPSNVKFAEPPGLPNGGGGTERVV